MVIVTAAVWERIRDDFSENEKEQLRGATCGDSICPRGAILDEETLGAELRAKIQRLNKRGRHDAIR
jgi:hypothetical protein